MKLPILALCLSVCFAACEKRSAPVPPSTTTKNPVEEFKSVVAGFPKDEEFRLEGWPLSISIAESDVIHTSSLVHPVEGFVRLDTVQIFKIINGDTPRDPIERKIKLHFHWLNERWNYAGISDAAGANDYGWVVEKCPQLAAFLGRLP
jgi:hypothetical protein